MQSIKVPCIKVTGTFGSDSDAVNFLCSLCASELGQRHHHVSTMEVERLDDIGGNKVVVITLRFALHVDFLIKGSIYQQGMLSPWQDNITVKEGNCVFMAIPRTEAVHG